MYHFIQIVDGEPTLGYGDNRTVVVGKTISVEGKPILCTRGLHASPRIIDALGYCPDGNVALCEVMLGGTVIEDDDKSVGQTRRIDRMLTAEQTETMLREFARWCALQVAHLWNMPDVVRQYLETGDNGLRAAAAAEAWSAWTAAEAAAEAAAAEAAWSAWSAAKAAWLAWTAARAARSAWLAWTAQETKLREMFEAHF